MLPALLFVKESLLTLVASSYLKFRARNLPCASQTHGFCNKIDALILLLHTQCHFELSLDRHFASNYLFARVEIIDKRHCAIYTSTVAIGGAMTSLLLPVFTTLISIHAVCDISGLFK